MVDYYYMLISAPCRSILMTAKLIGLDLNRHPIDLLKGEQFNPEFLKINPLHKVPVLVDGDFTLQESRAILGYIVEKYAKNDDLYPKDLYKRALVNQFLYFDMGTFYKSFGDYFYPQHKEKKPADPAKLELIHVAFDNLNMFLEGKEYVTGDKLTIADIALFASATTIEESGFDYSKYTNVARWLKHLKSTLPGTEENEQGSKDMIKLFRAM